MKALGGHCTYEDLKRFLSDPARALLGTDIGAKGYQDKLEWADLVVYLRTLSKKVNSSITGGQI
jgi:cytochrome c2